MNSTNRQKQHYNSIAEEYYQAYQNPSSLLFKELLWSYVFKHLPEPTSDVSVLEAMCGYAEGQSIIESHYCKKITYTGFDYSEKMIDIVKNTHPQKNVFVQDVTTFEPDMQYDIILIIGSLHHVPEHVAKVLGNLQKGLADNGYFINFEATHGNRITGKIRDRIYRSSPIIDYSTERDFPIAELNSLYSKAGLEIVHQFYPGLLSYSLYYNPSVFPRLARISQIVLKLLFAIERPFFKTRLAKLLSFATLTILRKASTERT